MNPHRHTTPALTDAMLLLCCVPCPPGNADAEAVAAELGVPLDHEAIRYAAARLCVNVLTVWEYGEVRLKWASEQDYRRARGPLGRVWKARLNGATA